MSRILIIRKIQEVLDASGQGIKGAEVAQEYATIVNLINRRIDTSKTYLEQGQIGEAVRVAEERPPLFDTCEMLSFERLAKWQTMCQLKGWPEAEPLKTEVLASLKEAFEAPEVLKPLIEVQRNAARTQDLRMAVRCLRRIVKLDAGNKTWLAMLASFEGRYLTELRDQFMPAFALKNKATMHRVAEELESGEWSVTVDPGLLGGVADMRTAEKTALGSQEAEGTPDSDLFATTSDEDVKVAPPVPALEVTTTKIEDERVEGWSPNPKVLLIACLILGALLLAGLSGLFWFGKAHYRKACDDLLTQNRELLEARGGSEYTDLKQELDKGNYKAVYEPLRELVKREKAELIVERRKAAEAESARKLAEEAELERKKAEAAEAERLRLEEEKRIKAEQEAAERQRQEEELRKKAEETEAERKRLEAAEAELKKREAAAAEQKRMEELKRRRAEALAAKIELERKRAEALAIRRQHEEEERLMQNKGFDTHLFMVVDLVSGPASDHYPVSFCQTEAEVQGGVQDEAYKTTKLLLRYITPGTFMMGSPREQLGFDETQPPREMSVTNGFFMGVFEVTQKQWELVMGSNPSYFEDAEASASRPVEQVSCYDIRENAATNKSDPDSNWPANHYVSENSFMGRLRLKSGISTFDLPNEIQWEYACRAGTTTALNSGKNIANMYIDAAVAEVGRYYSNGGRGYKRDGTTLIMTAPVGSYKPNAWGLYDMHGNVAEWCLDWTRLYATSGPRWKGTVVEQYSVLRGGGWDNVAWHCLVTSRVASKPFQRNYKGGFRLVRNKTNVQESRR